MTAFIRQEALEKAREIQLKADEEFAIEKSKLVRQETAAIDQLYEKKFKQASMSQQITRSTLANKTRLRVLSARQELLNDLFERAREKLAGVAKQKTKTGQDYQAILQGLILEGLYALNEDKVIVRARKTDYTLVRKGIEGATKEFKKTVGRDIKVEIDENEPLPDSSYVSFPLPGVFIIIIIEALAYLHLQSWRRFYPRWRRQDRGQQYLRRAPATSRNRCSTRRSRTSLWKEQEQEVPRLDCIIFLPF